MAIPTGKVAGRGNYATSKFKLTCLSSANCMMLCIRVSNAMSFVFPIADIRENY